MDVFTGLGAFDVGGAARAMGAIVSALAEAKAANLTPDEVKLAATVSGVLDA